MVGWLVEVQNLFATAEIAFITLIIGFILARLVQKLLRWIVREFEFKANLLPIIVEQLLYVVTIVVVLAELNLAWILLIPVGIVVLGVAVWSVVAIFAFVANFRARPRAKSKYVLGKTVMVDDIRGVVDKVGLTATKILGEDEIWIPHKYKEKKRV